VRDEALPQEQRHGGQANDPCPGKGHFQRHARPLLTLL
jgi:hypothetical protein